MNAPELHLKASGAIAPQIPGLPSAELAAMNDLASTEKAWAEAESLSRKASPEELQRDADLSEYARDQLFRQHFEIIAIGALWLVAIGSAALAGVLIWHFAAPTSLRWLSCQDVAYLQTVLTAGLLVGVIGNHFKKRMR